MFVDNSRSHPLDRIIFATGYIHDFSFIKTDRGWGDTPVFEPGHVIRHLCEDMFYIEDPTLVFAGIPKMTATFAVAEAQAAYLARCISARCHLPSDTWMRKCETDRFHSRPRRASPGNSAPITVHSSSSTTRSMSIGFPPSVSWLSRRMTLGIRRRHIGARAWTLLASSPESYATTSSASTAAGTSSPSRKPRDFVTAYQISAWRPGVRGVVVSCSQAGIQREDAANQQPA